MTVPLVINNFNDDNNTSKNTNNNNEDNNRLNIGHNSQNKLGTVLETINEVSNSKVDSSELSDDEDDNNNNVNKDDNNKSKNDK